jgi:protein-tyrosine phosphatase
MGVKKVLFVCLGNICRSPAAEGVFKQMVLKAGLEAQIHCDSAGTSGYHDGAPADSRMRQAASQRGYDLTSISRMFTDEDFEHFDIIVVMDDANYQDVLMVDFEKQYEQKVFRFREFCTAHQITGVPDPYFGGERGFFHVMDILEDGCHNLLERIRAGQI